MAIRIWPLLGTVSILLGRGDGTFQAAPEVAVGTSPNSVAVGDFNGDGREDLAVTNSAGNSVSILLGRGDGTFQAAPEVGGLEEHPSSVTVGDFNADGHQDLVTAIQAGPLSVSILLGRGDGTFQGTPEVALGEILFQSPWATSMATAGRIWPRAIFLPTPCRSCWGGAMAPSRPPQRWGWEHLLFSRRG